MQFIQMQLRLFPELLQDTINEHKLSFDPDDPRDFIDAFLVEMSKKNDKSFTVSTYLPEINVSINLPNTIQLFVFLVSGTSACHLLSRPLFCWDGNNNKHSSLGDFVFIALS